MRISALRTQRIAVSGVWLLFRSTRSEHFRNWANRDSIGGRVRRTDHQHRMTALLELIVDSPDFGGPAHGVRTVEERLDVGGKRSLQTQKGKDADFPGDAEQLDD